ncbi:hypothetical protein A2U01_0114549, partial [Trifolium medium]|nr:hypothetical protein [Trifolium medium]
RHFALKNRACSPSEHSSEGSSLSLAAAEISRVPAGFLSLSFAQRPCQFRTCFDDVSKCK